jgi:hypothetical protein
LSFLVSANLTFQAEKVTETVSKYACILATHLTNCVLCTWAGSIFPLYTVKLIPQEQQQYLNVGKAREKYILKTSKDHE